MKKMDTKLETLKQSAMAAANEELLARKGLEDAMRRSGYAAGMLAGYRAGVQDGLDQARAAGDGPA